VAVVEEIEEAWESPFETDKAWDALHRCLSDGTLDVTSGEPCRERRLSPYDALSARLGSRRFV
jgi:hypothetical protein